MANEKNINSRIQHKHDTEANWNKATNFSPKQGEIIVYDVDANYSYERFKIGDGTKKVNELPFASVNIDSTLSIEGQAADAKAVGDAFEALGALSTKDSVSKSDLATDIQASLDKADTALQSYTETDPTVPAWAKAASKPSYTASEVGLGNVDNVKQYSASNPPPYPVKSVNGKTGEVTVNEVPSCSTSDNGKILGVVDGAIAWKTTTIPDWNQNDATQSSYIENRTHWIEPVDFEWRGEPLFNSDTLENIPEGNIYLFECATTDKDFNVCTLSWGGSSWVVPVNQSKWSAFTPDSWMSFGPGAVSVLLDSGTLYLCSKSAGMSAMGVYAISDCGVVNYLPAAYIPSTIARLKNVVTSVNGQKGPVTIDIPEGVPDYTTSDNGKFLRVVNGSAAWVAISSAEGASF